MRIVTPSLLAVAIIVGAAAVAAGAVAEDKIVHQKGRVFSMDLIAVHRHEPLTFVNDDTVPHNIMSTSEQNSFDLGSQPPGKAIPVSFDGLGTVTVICAIHPRMRMTVKVVD